MLYESTRGRTGRVPSAEAVKKGIAPDGGLFVPENIVKITPYMLEQLIKANYQERAIPILMSYLTDYTETEIHECVKNAYSEAKFGSPEVVPVHKINSSTYILELWHGPTCAFKDIALQFLPHLLVKAVQKTGESKEIVILVATSGDTGKAALEGFKDVEGTRIIVFYPFGGVSEIQKMQMITQEGSNVYTLGVKGNFDDTQSGVKAIFVDQELNKIMEEKGYGFSSANSINWGRLVPQIVYYFSAYGDMVKKGEITPEDKINIVVPTGNFGNILAAFYAEEMGLPVNKLICASNENNVLTEFMNTGVYNRKRMFKKTISPSMDILISSNLERLLYEITGHDSKRICNWMKELKEDGIYKVDYETKKKVSGIFWASYSSEEETLNAIKKVYKDYGYLIDTHTAVGMDVYQKYVVEIGDKSTKTVIASTASPFKFSESVSKAVLGEEKIRDKDEFQLLEILSEECGIPIPYGLKDLDKKEIRHYTVCAREEMKKQVEKILGL
ncbi:MAG: threonine synthase [Firmicutes bacterium]|nr:threonine synthase [Bacillota bacterium]